MTRRNAENSRLAAERMKHAAGSVSEANGRLQQMIVSMNAIQASSDKVSKIIRTIDEIAFQTNILALNAAVEAARAGESGMGFAVVADEVRNLAHRSAEAARNTAVLIEESIANSKDGKSKLDQVSGAILSITKSADEVNRLVEEIRSGSEEQARGIEQVSRALANMQEATQTTAASAEESAAAGAELSAQSESMRQTVRGLAQMVGGQAGL
jgi:methyl-accepting chemotaxis protein